MKTALSCLKAAADAHGLPFDPQEAAQRHDLQPDQEPALETLAAMARAAGFTATPAMLRWEELDGLEHYPALLRLENANTVALVGFAPGGEGRVLLADPLARVSGPFELERQALERSWAGKALLLAPARPRTGLRALALAAARHGLELSPESLARAHALEEREPTPEELAALAREEGLKAQARTCAPEELSGLAEALPALVVLREGAVAVLAGIDPERGAVLLDPRRQPPRQDTLPMTDFLARWDGRVVLLKRRFRLGDEAQPFGLRWFAPEILRQGRSFADVALASLMMTVLALALPMYFQIVIDRVLAHKSLSTLQVLSLGMAAALAFEAGFSFLRGFVMQHATARIDARVASRTFARLLSLPLGFFGRSHAGALIQHMQQAGALREFLTGRLFFTLLDGLALLIFVPVLFLYSPQLAALVLGFSGLLAATLFVLVPAFKKRLLELYRAEGERQSFLVETIRGMETVKSLSLEPQRRRGWDERAAHAAATRFRVGRLSTAATAATGFLEKLMGLAVPWAGVYLVLDHSLSVGALIAFQMLSGRVSGPLVQIVSLIHEYQEKALSVRMLAGIMNEPPERGRTAGGLRPPVKGEVRFERVSFRYVPGGQPALADVSVVFPAGGFTGIVGRSGSGKSTLGRLIQGLYAAQSGVVRVDGHDVREFDLEHLRRHIAVVPQESFLFRGTVRENIGISCLGAGLDEIARAAALAGADEFIARLPQGFDTPLEENASNLSGGQRQRLAIARALLAQPRVLLFDEATSALDAESEVIIQDNLARIAHGRTTIMISHRLSMLAGADLIVVMDEGRVADAAPHETLLTRCALYRDLWESQNRHVLGRRAPGGASLPGA
ncbi:Toxin RTX-I translocation ATP-binding protein [Fundidesulfovibrio magnetotacticus]|uniref:Toxin RTX-I translocation ATP-binding protein n=1 Tax=Fundidesulfovibrio magnetotacticus TaxID=2730080 RepID=A0A6V8LTR5_9BACT|nr:ABC transporter transmembrane domain-containing protein [Fundidesulfovibrio magnetotacticus]GFK93489.1 Toxin RTX-I translocation ATP-binding protein [Fundidesulfovibrio magnetotacticus]